MAVLRTGRLRLRRLGVEDAGAMTRLLQDCDVSQWLSGLPCPMTVAHARAFIARAQSEGARVWAIEDDSGYVGQIGIGAELGYWLTPRVWGRGYATEAGYAVVSDHFEAGGTDLLAGVHPDNAGSVRVLEKLGFAPVARRPEVFGGSDALVLRHIYRLQAACWHGLRQAAE